MLVREKDSRLVWSSFSFSFSSSSFFRLEFVFFFFFFFFFFFPLSMQKRAARKMRKTRPLKIILFALQGGDTKKHFDRFANTLQAWKWADLGDDEKNTIKSDERSRRMKFCVIRTRRRHVVFTFIACVCA